MKSRLVVDAGNGKLIQAGTSTGKGVAFYGAALKEAGYSEFSPLVHAIRPVGPGLTRYSIVLFWLLPGVDLSQFSTRVTNILPIPYSRIY
jgi:hypothetical protein